MNPDTPAERRIAIRVQPGASRQHVGGRRGEALAVAVTAKAVDGRATAAALRAVADAFGVRPAAVRLVSGATSRNKIVAVSGEPDALDERLLDLLNERAQ